MTSGAAVTIGWLADRVLGEPPTPVHPVAWFGRAMTSVERESYRDSRFAGVAHLAIGVTGALVAGGLLTRLLGRRVATAVAVFVSVAGKMLADEADAVLDAVASGDLPTARERLPALVGRDPSHLDEDEIIRAVIESLAENTVDAVVASVFWGAVGGAPAVLAHRAVNTLDAMVGHRDDRYRRFGWASARLDDVVNYLPARLAAVGVATLAPGRWSRIRRAVAEEGPRHPSPNGGVIEAAYAAALDVRLGGVNRYGDRVEDRGALGDGRTPTIADGRRAVVLSNRLGALVAVLAALRP